MAYYFFNRLNRNRVLEIEKIVESFGLKKESEMDEPNCAWFDDQFGTTNEKKISRIACVFPGSHNPKTVNERKCRLGIQTPNKFSHKNDLGVRGLVKRCKLICGTNAVYNGLNIRYPDKEFRLFDDELRRKVFRAMGDFAQDTYLLATPELMMGIDLSRRVPKPFDPTIFDKRIFGEVIVENEENLEQTLETWIKETPDFGNLNNSGAYCLAAHLMLRFYFPRYGEYSEHSEHEVKEIYWREIK